MNRAAVSRGAVLLEAGIVDVHDRRRVFVHRKSTAIYGGVIPRECRVGNLTWSDIPNGATI